MSKHICGEWSCFDCPHKIECDPVYEDEDTARCGLECPARTRERELLMVLEFYASAANWKKHQHNMDKPIGGDICQGCWVSEVEKDLGSRAREAIQKAKGKG